MDDKALSNTKGYLRKRCATFIEVRTVKLPTGKEQEVVIFSGTKSIVAQATIYNTIVVHEDVFRSEKLKDYVMVHEISHIGQWYNRSPFRFSIIIPPILTYLVTQNIAVTCIVAAAFFFGFSLFIEFNADSQAIRTLGIETVRDARVDERALFHQPIFWRILDRMTHPPISLTYIVMRTLNRDTGRQ